MPSLYGAGIRIRLAALPLAETITPKIVLKKGDVAAKQCAIAEEKLYTSAFLDEERVKFPGDEDGFAVNWVGNAPFLQVVTRSDAIKMAERGGESGDKPKRGRARNGLVALLSGEGDKEGTALERKQSLRRKSATEVPAPQPKNGPSSFQSTARSDIQAQDESSTPKALVLHVMLSKKTFYESFDDGNPQHLKVDVFFNGQLSASTLVAGPKSPHHHIFAGSRVDYLVERPWVIFQSGQTKNENLQGTESDNHTQQRWDQICEALVEAANQQGIDENEERSPSAVYLQELASMPMPDDVQNMQKANTRNFGVVDIVVTVGKGKKVNAGTTYLTNPARLVDEKYAYEIIQKSEMKDQEGKGDEQEQVQVQPDHGTGQIIKEGAAGVFRQEGLGENQEVEGETELNITSSTPGVVPTQNSPADLPIPLTFHDPFKGTPIPVLSTNQSADPPYGSPFTHSVGLESSSEQKRAFHSRKRGFSDFIDPTLEGSQDEARDPGQSARRLYSSANMSFPPQFSPPAYAGSGFYTNQYGGFTSANPYQLPYASMMQELNTAGIPGIPSADERFPKHLKNSSASQVSVPSTSLERADSIKDAQSSGALFSSSPFPTPNVMRNPAYGMAFVASSDTSPHLEPSPKGTLPANGAIGRPGVGFASSPLTQPYFPPPYLAPFQSSPFWHTPNRPPVGPPPEVGLFSATTKPKSTLPKNAGLFDLHQTCASRLIKRLIIKGKDGAIIVDHHWQTARRFSSKHFGYQNSLPNKINPKNPQQNPPSQAKCSKSPVSSSRPSGMGSVIATPQQISPQNNMTPYHADFGQTKRDSVQDGPAESELAKPSSPFPIYGTKDVLPLQGIAPNSNDQVDCSNDNFSTPIPNLRTNITRFSGVQIPKAKVSVLEASEELPLKEVSPSFHPTFQSVSPMDIDPALFDVPADSVGKVAIQAANRISKTQAIDGNSSSPLSSPPTSPTTTPSKEYHRAKVGMRSVKGAAVLDSSAPSPQNLPLSKPLQLTSNKSISPPLQASSVSPSKQSVVSTPDLIKKKKVSLHLKSRLRFAKTPRSPGRFSTKDNPPLNENCIIQFAESQEDGGALRQIRSERQGFFTEESVVVGVRFFVAG